MIRKVQPLAVLLVLAAGLVFLTPAASEAAMQGRGRGGYRGGWGGGYRGGYYGGYRGGYYGGYRGGYYGGYPRVYGGYYRPYYGYGYRSYYWPRSYSYAYPYSYGYYPMYSYATPIVTTGPVVTTSGYTPMNGVDATVEDGAPVTTAMPARVTLEAPAGAQVWFDGESTVSTGSLREFSTPPLEPGRRYSYDVRATSEENGRTVTQSQRVRVTPGAHVTVRFPTQEAPVD